LAWQLLTREQDYIYERPVLTFRELRHELIARAPAEPHEATALRPRRTRMSRPT
jgi:hypothetical protein